MTALRAPTSEIEQITVITLILRLLLVGVTTQSTTTKEHNANSSSRIPANGGVVLLGKDSRRDAATYY